MKKVILYYHYVKIDDPEKERISHLRICAQLGLKGRVIIAKEGINGTLSGEEEKIEAYKEYMHNHPLFSSITYKEGIEDADVFRKLSIKIRSEIVALKLDDDIDVTDPTTKRGTYLEPEAFHDLLNSNDEYYIVDVRNDYESDIGKFKGSIALNMSNFRDLPNAINEIANLKDKKIITVCTGGVRCEKASAYLLTKGFQNVYQLHGGIVTYGKLFPQGDFTGKCYVFDSRIAIELNDDAHASVIAHCYHCHMACDRYINCCNAECNRQFVCCEECEAKYEKGCSLDCKENSRYKTQYPESSFDKQKKSL